MVKEITSMILVELKLKDGALTPTGRLLVDFDFFSHGSGDYFDIDSHIQVLY